MKMFVVMNNKSTQLRSKSDFVVPKLSTEYFGANSVRYLDSVTWNSLPWNAINIATFSDFNESIKKWKPDCPSRICKIYISGVGFVNHCGNLTLGKNSMLIPFERRT